MIQIQEVLWNIDKLSSEKFMGEMDKNKIKKILDISCMIFGIPSGRMTYRPQEKDVKLAENFRERGNRYFDGTIGETNYVKCLEEYTKSVAHSPPRSRELSLAYDNRSALFLQKNLFNDCLLDIERASQMNYYPQSLRSKLFLRKAKCLQSIDPENEIQIDNALCEVRKWFHLVKIEKERAIKTEYQKYMEKKLKKKKPFQKNMINELIFELNCENSMIPGFSDAIELRYSEEFERHLVATRDIRPGEVIAIQKPYANIPFIEVRYKLCWHCGSQVWSSVSCENCVDVIYCSEKCREDGDKEHHDIECPIIRTLIAHTSCNLNCLVASRIIVMAFKEYGNSFETLKNDIKNIKTEFESMKKGCTNKILEPNKFSSVYGLDINFKGCHINRERFSLSIIIAYIIATESNILGEKIVQNMAVLKENADFIFLIELVAKILYITCTNTIDIPLTCKNLQAEETLMSRAIIPSLSLFNHSFNSGTYNIMGKDGLTLITRYLLKENEQIFTSYEQKFWEVNKL